MSNRGGASVERKVALIAGGARGIGRAAAVALADKGWSIATCYRRSESDALQLTELLKEKGVPAMTVCADVSDPAAARELVQEVEARWERIDALVNCVGPYHRVNLLEETPEGWLEMFDNNLHPVFYLSRAAATGMIERKWGRIVSFSMASADQHNAQPSITAHYIERPAY